MTDNELKEIRQKISCPRLGDKHYGEWGILTKNQRFMIKRMLDYIESQEEYINRLQAENQNLKGHLKQLKSRYDIANQRLQDCIDEQDIEISRLYKMIDETKAEAYKECAEKIKQKTLAMIWSPDEISTDDYIGCIDDVVKELEGEN